MALPTMAQWTDGWAGVTVYPSLGELYASQSHIFRAMGVPTPYNKGRIRVNWTDGAGAGAVQTAAGAPQNASAAPAQVNDTFNLDFGALGSQAYTDIGIDMMGGGFEDQKSLNSAMAAIYSTFVSQLVGTANGDDYELWGLENFYDETAVIAAGMVSESGNSDSSLLLDYIDIALASLPDTGYNICITSKEAYAAVKKAIRSLGGTNPEHTAVKDYGFYALLYSDCAFFHSRHVESDISPTSATNPDSAFHFINIGDEGAQVLLPGTEDPFLVQGPKTTAGYFNEVWDIALKCQVVYLSPRAAYKLVAVYK